MRPNLRATVVAATLYAIVNDAIRLVAGTRMAMDDAKTNLFTQVWRWGYQADNPPMFEWLIKLAHGVTGGGLPSFLLVKSLCLIAAAAFMHLAVRRFANERTAFATAVGMVLLYQVGWNFHQAFTHSALLLTACCAGLWAGVRLVQRQEWRDYLVFGAVAGCGMMAKYNFALFLVGFLVASLTCLPFRRAVASPRLLVSIGIALLLFSPHLLWFISRVDVYAGTLDDTLGLEGAWAARVASGLAALAVATISFFVPWGLVYGVLLRRRSDGEGADTKIASLLTGTSVVAIIVIAVGIVAFGVGAVSERYVIPALLPAYAGLTAALLGNRPHALRPYVLASLAVAVLCSLLRLVGFLVPQPPFCDDCWAFVPYEVLEERLAETVPPDAILLAREENTAGNLVVAFPAARITSLNLLTQFNPTEAATDRSCFYVWSEDMAGGVPLFPVFAFAYDDPRTVMVEAPWRHPLRPDGFRRTVWGITPLDGPLYERFCTAGAPG